MEDIDYPGSEGEQYIAEFLDFERIRYFAQYKIEHLKGDSKSYRISDFYLPRYDLHIEFLGKWNGNLADKENYKEKMNVYRINKIACVYVFPDNLGILDFMFYLRARKALKTTGRKKENVRFQFDQFIKYERDNFLFLLGSLFILYLIFYDFDWFSFSFFLGISIYLFREIFLSWRHYQKRM